MIPRTISALAIGLTYVLACGSVSAQQATGPLRVHPSNSRYFTDDSGRAVYLTGSHTWASLVERRLEDGPLFDFDAYLGFLAEHNHNFMRLWAWEHAAWMQFTQHKVLYHPHPWLRTGPGVALDGKPKFDLTKFNDSFFRRLRQRVGAAGDRGIYVAVMLFQGFSIEQKGTEGVNPQVGNPWRSHPFHTANNINQIAGDKNDNGEGEEVHTLADRRITELQGRYVRNMIDTVGDLNNVLWEISNESHGDSTEWQYHMIDLIHAYQRTKPKQHPVGMTFQYGKGAKRGTDDNLFRGPADWISPSGGRGAKTDPLIADGRKVIINDTDHIWGIGGNGPWVWKCFTRGHNVIFMDPYLDFRSHLKFSLKTAHRYDPTWDPIRKNLGYTRRYAAKMNLADMGPRGDLASTGYCLANVIQAPAELLVFAPQGGAFSVDLTNVTSGLQTEWFNPTTGMQRPATEVQGNSRQTFQAPFDGPAVLYLQSVNTGHDPGQPE